MSQPQGQQQTEMLVPGAEGGQHNATAKCPGCGTRVEFPHRQAKEGPGHLFWQMTPGGYKFGECVSALQKSIRRGKPREALFFAVEIESCGRRSGTYLWNRLKIILSEDIGPTRDGNALVATLNGLEQNNRDHIERTGHPCGLFLSHAIIAMCMAEKSRVNTYLERVVYCEDKNFPIPDEALDMHTSAGKKMGRGIDHFMIEGAQVHPHSEEFAELEEELLYLAWESFRSEKPQKYSRRYANGSQNANTAVQRSFQ